MNKRTCQKCGKRQPTALHVDDLELIMKDEASRTESQEVNTAKVDNRRSISLGLCAMQQIARKPSFCTSFSLVRSTGHWCIL